MNLLIRPLIAVALISCTLCSAQKKKNIPYIGYLFPAGAQRGTTKTIIAGGQYLTKGDIVHISGKGVTGKVVGQGRTGFNNIQRVEREILTQIFKMVRDRRLKELSPDEQLPPFSLKPFIDEKLKDLNKVDLRRANALFSHPLLRDLETMSLRQLAHTRTVVFYPRRMLQQNRQLAEGLIIEITVAPDAEPGLRELRIITQRDVSNPIALHIGTLPEVNELEPNNKQAHQPYHQHLKMKPNQKLPEEKALTLPVTVNGQIMPGDIDRLRFKAKGGEKLVISAQARSLIPYLADAVPGWFQATMTLYNSRGKEIAYADDFRFNPDPVLFFEIPEAGEYELSIHDSIYRGREDFVYRISIAEQPFITSIFPLGVGDTAVDAKISGWNLDSSTITLTPQPDQEISHSRLKTDTDVSNEVSYMTSTIPTVREDLNSDLQQISLPLVVDGRIEQPSDTDSYQFTGIKDQKITLEVQARKLNSPLDSLVKITGPDGSVVALNDDHVLKDTHLHKDIVGLATHHADSYLNTTLPETGTYTIQITDSRKHGGGSFGYRLRVSETTPDFALRVTPSSLSLRQGTLVPIEVHVLRRDSFDGAITINAKDPTTGFQIIGNEIPAGCDRIAMTLRAPKRGQKEPFELELQGTATLADGSTITRTALPADDTMQAFLFRHLVPAKSMMVKVEHKGKWAPPVPKYNLTAPAKLEAGNSVNITVTMQNTKILKDIKLALDNAPEGLKISTQKSTGNGFEFTVSADETLKKSGRTNLIIAAYRTFKPKSKNGKPVKPVSYLFGYLPALSVDLRPAPENPVAEVAENN